MYTLQEIPDMADKVMDWKGSKLAKLVSPSLLEAETVGAKLVGVPSTAEAFSLLYNKQVLDKAGVDPSKITTRQALEVALRKVKAAGSGGVPSLQSGGHLVLTSQTSTSLTQRQHTKAV